MNDSLTHGRLNAHAMIVNNTGLLGQQFPDMAVRHFLWESLAPEIRQFLMQIEETENFEQQFIFECMQAGLVERIDLDEPEESSN